MAKRPVIFLTFANDRDEHLYMLKQESRALDRILYPLHDKQAIEIYAMESAEIEDIFFGFNRFRERISIFHYAGHANGSHLRLEDQNADSRGLARLLGEEKSLQLVFLNGCSTKGQVEKLLELGVKSVIATSVPINDEMAMDFAKQFYQSLAKISTIEQAFNHAVAFMETKYGTTKGAKVFRSISWDGMEEELASKDLPWGLYVNEGSQDVLKWKLPDYRQVQLPEGFGASINERYKVNQYLISVLDSMIEFNSRISNQVYDRFGNQKDPRELPGLIIENFPWPIGAQLRILFVKHATMRKPGLPRLKQLVSTYAITMQFLNYILLSQLWDEKEEKAYDLDDDFATIFPTDDDAFLAYNFFELFQKLCQVCEDNEVETFIPEYKEVFKEIGNEGDLFGACNFLQSIHKQIANGLEELDKSQAKKMCNETEFCLSVLLKKAAFLAKYQLITVKDIAIFAPKGETAQFAHQMSFLNASDEGLLAEIQRRLNVYTDSHSIIIVKSGDMKDYLNLSPFLIDKNAFEREEFSPPNIYMLACRDDYEFKYLFVNPNLYEALENPSDQIDDDSLENEMFNDLLTRQFELYDEAME